MTPLISIVVPCYNEQDNLAPFLARLHAVLGNESGTHFEIIAINDGSTDQTLTRMLELRATYPQLCVIDLSRNFGKEAALTAGLDHAQGNAVIPIDADLQHPPELIPDMLEKWREGYEVVLARRRDRQHESWLKRHTARLFYRLQQNVAKPPIPADVGDFRLMDRRVVDALRTMRESQRFMKGLFAWVGFNTTTLDYDVAPRQHGHTSFHPLKLIGLAIEGITSFSVAPLRLASLFGFIIALLALGYASLILIQTLIFGIDQPGYASLITTILFIGGIQLISIGILGEYIGRIYAEVKNRPLYIVRSLNGERPTQADERHAPR